MTEAEIETTLTAADRIRFGNDPSITISTNLKTVESRIVQGCERSGRARDQVRLLPITKTVPHQILRLAFEVGVHTFGENKIQEAMGKQEALVDIDAQWSIVGHLQTNKVKYLVRFASEFHALDSIKLANELDARLKREERFLDVFVQVNTSREVSKFGLHPEALMPFLDELCRFSRLRVQGLMTLAVFSSDMSKARPCFQLLRRLRDTAAARYPNVTKLSMGMSGDFEEAIEEGADIVRVGQAIFGARPTPDAHYWPEHPNASSVPSEKTPSSNT